MHAFVRRTGRQTDGKADLRNSVRCITCSRTVKRRLAPFVDGLLEKDYFLQHVRIARPFRPRVRPVGPRLSSLPNFQTHIRAKILAAAQMQVRLHNSYARYEYEITGSG